MSNPRATRVVTVELDFDPEIDPSLESFETLSDEDVLACGRVVYSDCILHNGVGAVAGDSHED